MRRNILLLAVCQGLMMTGNALLVASSALIGLALADDKSLATLPLALQFLSTMLTSFPASLLMGRIGRRRGFMLASLIGLVGAVIGTLAIRTGWFWGFCVAAMLIGVFNGFAIYYRFAAADSVADDYRNRAVAYVLAGGVAAAFLGPNLANWTRELVVAAPFAGSLASLIAVYATSFVLISRLDIPPPHTTVASDGHGRSLMAIASQPMFVVAVVCAMLGYGIMSFVMTATPLAMQHDHHAFADTAFVIQWHVFAMFAPSFVTGSLIDRFGVLNVMLAGAVLAALCVAVNLAGSNVWHYWGGLLLLGVAWNFLFVGATTLSTQTYTALERPRAQGLNDVIVFTVVSLASLSAGVLQQRLGWWWINVGAIPAIVITALTIIWLKYYGTRVAAATL